MAKIKILTGQEFEKMAIGQKFEEACCAGSTFTKAVKVSHTSIEKLDVDTQTFLAFCEKKVFNPEFDWLKPVHEFQDANRNVKTFEELKKQFLR